MEGLIQFISDFNQFRDAIFTILRDSMAPEILLSGICARVVLNEIVEKIIETKKADRCKIIVPNIIGKDGLSKGQIHEVSKLGGKIKVNGNSINNIIVIDGNAFVINCSYKYSKENGVRTSFENCIMTNHESAVETIKNTFYEKWNGSFPLAIEHTGRHDL